MINNRIFVLFITTIVATFFISFLNVSASISPDTVNLLIEKDECYTITKTVEIPSVSIKADILFSFDLSRSMNNFIENIKANANEIINELETKDIDLTVGVVSYMDYPYNYDGTCDYPEKDYGHPDDGDYPFQLDQSLTGNFNNVINTINGLKMGNGGDTPESYTRVFYESYSNSSIGWRNDAKKILINFADNVPHDCNLNENIIPDIWSTGKDPGPDALMNTMDDLDLQDVLSEMAFNEIILLECHASESIHWDYWTNLTGGNVILLDSDDFLDDVIDCLISDLLQPKIFDLHLEVISSGFENWLDNVDPISYAELHTGSTVFFNETICVPVDTPAGVYEFIVSVVDEDGVSYGLETNTITVPNDPPVSYDDFYDTYEDNLLDVNVPGILANDIDIDGDTLIAINLSSPENGYLNLDSEGSFIYIPDPDFNGIDSFTYVANDSLSNSNIATVYISVNDVNDPPDRPNESFPIDGSKRINTNTILKWNCSDIDNDNLTYDIFLGTENPPPLFAQNISNNSIYVELEYLTTYFWRVVARDTSNETNSSETWKFITKKMLFIRPPLTENQNPIADASAGEPYKGYVREEIIFDGSNSFDPDTEGYIWEWYWDFGDGKNATGEKVKHVYEKNGTYEVNLTVVDNREGNDSDIFKVIIAKANHPPSKPIVNGPLKGHQNKDYEFSATSTDFDDESIRFVFDWADGEQSITEFLPTGNTTYQSHNWTKYGKYVVSIYAQDNDTESETSEITILIDIHPISGLVSGNLIDLDSDNSFEMFENSFNGILTYLGFENGTYLIDSNSNNVWDHTFNTLRGISTYYEYLYQKFYPILENDLKNLEILESPGFDIIIVLAAVLFIVIVFKRRK